MALRFSSSLSSLATVVAVAGLSMAVAMTMLGCNTTERAGQQRSALEKGTAQQWEGVLPQGENAASQTTWWASWNDPTLLALLAWAQQHNPGLAQASARIAQARASASAAGARLWPSLNLNAGVTASRNPLATFGAGEVRQSVASTGLDALWEIDLFGANAANRHSMQARLEASETEWHDVRISLAAEVANTYLSLRSCEAQAAGLQQVTQSQQISQQLQEQKIVAGFISLEQLAQQDAQLANLLTQARQQEFECASLLKSLVMLVDLPESEVRDMLQAGHAVLPQAGHFIVETVPVKALLARPDMRAALLNLVASGADIDAAQARRYPSISLLGSINLLGIRIAGTNSATNSWSFGPSLTLPLLDAGARKAQVDLAQARHAEAQAAFRQKTLLAVREVEQALLRLDLANHHLQQHQRIETSQNTALQAAEAGWRFGSVSRLEMEQARRQQLLTQGRKWQLQGDRASAWIALYKALGGDWQSAGEQPSPMSQSPQQLQQSGPQ